MNRPMERLMGSRSRGWPLAKKHKVSLGADTPPGSVETKAGPVLPQRMHKLHWISDSETIR